MEDLTGKQFGHYQIVAPLGEGGMAAVYKAFQPSMERYVAIKVLPRHMANSEEFVARFKREARLLAQLQHPHILPVFDYGESDGYTYIVMPFLQSGTLADLLRTRRLNLIEIRRVMTQIGDALAYAHARGMIHRDIKPSNVLIDERGNCLLTDFGLARMTESSAKLTSSGAIMGTPAYMSPEQGTGSHIDGRSDIYSLGIIFYEMVTGRVPYTAETPIAIVFKHIQDPLPPARKINPELPEEVEMVLLKALAKNPDDRYQKAEDFVHALQMAIPETTVPLSRPAASQATVIDARPASGMQINSATISESPGAARPTASQPPLPVSTPTALRARKASPPPKWLWAALAGVVILIIVGALGVGLLNGAFGSTASEEATPTSAQASVSTEAPPVNAPIEIIAGNSFRDDFDGQLADDWTWFSEDPAKWSLTNQPGSLEIVASSGSLDGTSDPTNLLGRFGGDGDFEISTLVHFDPVSNFQFAGLIVFQDGSNAVQLGRAYCDLEDTCFGSGVYFDSVEDATFNNANFKEAYDGADTYLRLRRVGNIYSGYYSSDGTDWILLGEYTRDLSGTNVGLIADQSPENITATFDEFTWSEPPSIKANTDFNCFAAPTAGAEILATLGSDSTVQLRSTSMDGNWLYIQNPDDYIESCWISYKSNSLQLGETADLVTLIDTTPTPTLVAPPTVAIPTDREFVVINSIEVNADGRYVVSYETYQYTEKLPGMHVHFFFNTVPFDQAGNPGTGPWKLYGGPRPFTGYRTSDRPKNASQICALVANSDHSVKPDSGICFPLPDIATVTARIDTTCQVDPSSTDGAIAFGAGVTTQLLGITTDQSWLKVQNPDNLNVACWVPYNDMQINGDASDSPIVDPANP